MRGPVSIASAFASLDVGFSRRFSFLAVVFLIVSLSTDLRSQNASVDPDYNWIAKADLPTITVTDLNTEDLTISIATDPLGNVYTLSFGKGVDKRDANGNLLDGNFISAAGLDNPLDIAIDKEGFIYVADFLAAGPSYEDNGKIKVFDPEGNYLPERTILTSFYRPLGVDVNSEKVYVAEFNDGNSGPEDTQLSRIRIYDKFTGAVLRQTTQVQTPYRIAVNSKEEVYVSQTGNNDPGVLIFDSDLNLLGELPNIVSPGSVVVDNLDFVHVIEYDNRIDFSEFINFEELGFGDIIDIAEQIKNGSDNEDFIIKIFDPSNTYLSFEVDKVDFPVDLTFNDCDRMYVNNSEVFGSTIPFVGFVPSQLEFDLEIYRRTPSFDIEAPIAICTPAGKEFTLENGSITLTPEDLNNGSTDNCGIASMSLSQSTFTTQGEYSISLTVTDISGNTHSCITSITILTPATELTIGCPDNELSHKNENCQFVVPDYTALANPSNPEAVITQSPVKGTVIEEDTEVILTATLGDLTASCSFQLEIIDRTHVEFQCPSNITGTYDSSEGYELPDYIDQISFHDNCDPDPMITQDPPPGTIIFEEETVIVIRVKDASENFSQCSFILSLTDVSEPLQFTLCPEPEPEVLDPSCQSLIPDLTVLAETNHSEAEVTQTPSPGEVVEGTRVVEIELVATLEGETSSCIIFQDFVDLTPPVFSCPGDLVETYDPAMGYVLPDYSSLAEGMDSCGEVNISQFPSEGTVVFGDTPIELTLTDPSGNNGVCNFQLILEEITEPTFECPESGALVPLELNSECKVEAPPYEGLLSSFEGFENDPYFVQTEVQDGNLLNVSINVYDGEGGTFVGECNFEIALLDSTPPQINCPGTTVSLSPDENGKYILPDFRDRASDTCDSELEVVQDPPPGEITSGKLVTLKAVDDSGNASQTCEFEVVLVQEVNPSFECPEFDAQPQIALDENCSYGNPDFYDQLKNFRNFKDSPLFVQSLQLVGNMLQVNIRVYDGEQKEELFVGECFFELQQTENIDPQAACVQEITVTLDENGTARITPAEIDNGSTDGCGIVSYELSQDTFTSADIENSPIEVELTVADAYENFDKCIVLVTVEPHDPAEPGAVTCVTSITLPLNASGEAQLDLEQLYEGDLGPEGTVSVDKEFFTCSDLGEQIVILQFSGNQTTSCTVTVNVVDDIAPTPLARDLEIFLDENGTASITAADLDNGSTDNCGTGGLEFTVNQTSFSCPDVGLNSVAFTVTDASGNSATGNANVIVQDPLNYCSVDPVDPPEDRFVVLFPNPSRGRVQIATSRDIVLERVEIFDIRGRFLDARELTKDPATRSYLLDLQEFQTGVYTLRLFTEEREYIRRAIITTY